MTTHIAIDTIDIEEELRKYDAEQAEIAKQQAEQDKINREAKMAELQRKAKINSQISEIIQEQDTLVTTDTINTLLPWIIHNIQLADSALVNELVKKANQPLKQSKQPKQTGSNPKRTYLLLDANKFKSEHFDLYRTLTEKTGVASLEANRNLLIVTAKNYGASFKHLVEDKGFKAIPKSKGQNEISATAVMLQTYAIAKKVVENKHIDTLEKIKTMPVEFFTQTA